MPDAPVATVHRWRGTVDREWWAEDRETGERWRCWSARIRSMDGYQVPCRVVVNDRRSLGVELPAGVVPTVGLPFTWTVGDAVDEVRVGG
jgi:hypothetical protein